MVGIILGGIVLVILLIWQIQKWILYDIVMAKCTGIIIGRNRGGGIVTKHSKATYIYTYNGKEYVFREKECFGSAKRKDGEMHKIYVKKNKPWMCITSAENTVAAYELALGILLVFMGMLNL